MTHFFEERLALCENCSFSTIFANFGGVQDFLEDCSDYMVQTQTSVYSLLPNSEDLRIPKEKDAGSSDRGYRWFFHFHSRGEKRATTKGHFHLYAGPQHFNDPASMKPTHLIAIELDSEGDLSGFFVPNAWATNEYMRDASLLETALNHFETTENSPARLLDIWLGALLREFKDKILKLLQNRDVFLGKMSASERASYLEDKQIDRICEMKF